jgi:isocitrate dehydrogenase (NAD+)
MAAMSHRVVLVPGDGVGPELVAAARRAIEATGAAIEWDRQEAGQAARERTGSPLPAETVLAIRDAGVAFKGATTSGGPGPGPPSANIELRRAFDLHLSVRPARSMARAEPPGPAVDLVLASMTQEDLYAGVTVEPGSDRARLLRDLVLSGGALEVESAVPSVIFMTRLGAEDVARTALSWARRAGRSRVTVVHHADSLPATDGLLLDAARRLAADFPAISVDDLELEGALHELDHEPGSLDVLLTPTGYTRVLNERISEYVGGIGMMPRASLGSAAAVFDTVHGSAPARAGQDNANPIAQILAGALLLRHLREQARAERLEAAVEEVVAEGRTLTRDVAAGAPAASTTEVTDAIIARIPPERRP